MSTRQTKHDKTIRYISAIRCLMLGQIYAARRALETHYQSQNIDSEGNFLYGVICLALGQSDRGLSYLNKTSGKITHPHVKAAVFLDEISKPNAANITYQEALKLAGKDTDDIKKALYRAWGLAIGQNRPHGFTAERLADLGVSVAVPHAPLLSFGR